MKEIYCRNCKWYAPYRSLGPNFGIFGYQAIQRCIIPKGASWYDVDEKVEGHPPSLNKNNDCKYYKEETRRGEKIAGK